MAKRNKRKQRTQKKQQTTSTRMVLGAAVAIAVIIVAVAAIAFQGSDTPELTLESGLISPTQYISEFDDTGIEHYLLDVRTPEEFAAGHIVGAVNINVEELAQRYGEIPTDLPIVLYCRTGNRSGVASQMMAGVGFTDVYDIDGGIVAWAEAGLVLTQ